MKVLLPPLCLLLSLTATAQNQAFEVLSLQHLTGPRNDKVPPTWGTMLHWSPGNAGERNDMIGASSAVAQFSGDSVLEMLRSMHAAAIDENRLHLQVQGPSLIAVGETAEVAVVKAELQFARDVLCRPLQIEFAVWDATDRETPPAVMNAAEYQRFTTNRTQLWRALGTTQPGVPVTLTRERWTRYVRDIDVEVAQKQTATSPVTDSYGEGGQAMVRALPMFGDEFALQVQFVNAQKRGIVRALQTGMPGAADIELPMLETCYGACSARVPNGGAAAATMRGHATGGGQFVLTFRVSSGTPPPTDTRNGIGIFPCAAITDSGLRMRMAPPPALLGDDSPGNEEVEGFGQIDQDLLQELIRAAHPTDFEQEGSSLRQGGGYLFVRCSPEGLTRIAATLRKIQDQLVRTATVTHVGVLSASDGGGSPTTPVLHELSLPTLLGRELTVARLLESAIVRDVFCKIAQEAASLDLNVDTLQAGTWMRARVAPSGTDAHAQMLMQCTHAPVPSARTLMPGGGVLMPTDIATTQVDHDGAVVNAQPVDQGEGPAVTLDGRSFRTTLNTTIRW